MAEAVAAAGGPLGRRWPRRRPLILAAAERPPSSFGAYLAGKVTTSSAALRLTQGPSSTHPDSEKGSARLCAKLP